MALPIRTTVNDIEVVCTYLATKPTGASAAEAKAVLNAKVLDTRKLSAFKFWGLIRQTDEKMQLTQAGQRLAKDKCARRGEVLREVVARVKPYSAMVERAVHSGDLAVTASEVAAHWHNHFTDEVSGTDKILNDQAVCFFQLAQGADLGRLTIGRQGKATRFEFGW